MMRRMCSWFDLGLSVSAKCLVWASLPIFFVSCASTPPQPATPTIDDIIASASDEEIYRHANDALDGQRYQDAVRLYTAIVTRDPNHLGALVNAGVASRRLGDVDGAIEWYDRALDVEPRDQTALQNRIIAGLLLGRIEETVEFAARLAEVLPDDPVAWTQLAELHVQLRQFDQAIAAFERAVMVSPGNAETCYRLGLALAAQNRYEEASQQFEKALLLNPNLREAYAARVQILVFLEQFDAAWAAVVEGQKRGAIFDADLILDLQRRSGQVGPQ